MHLPNKRVFIIYVGGGGGQIRGGGGGATVSPPLRRGGGGHEGFEGGQGGGGHESLTLPMGSFFWRVAHCCIIRRELWAPLYESTCMQELINKDFS